MTAIDPGIDIGRQFLASLSNQAIRGPQGFQMSGAIHLPMIASAVRNGWTIADLGVYCSRRIDVDNPGGLVTARLVKAAKGEALPPVKTVGLAKFVQPKPWCGVCDDTRTRWLLDDAGTILGRCPTCWTDPK